MPRRRLARLRARLAARIAPRAWATVQRPNPRRARPLPELRLFAVLGTWMEADVVGACVRNARTQGCERVFLVDNASPDDTVAEAVAAGAEPVVSYGTARFEERMRADLMNGVVRQVSLASGEPYVWWLYLDADEFPHGPGGRTIRELLAALDRRFRVVGAHYYEHFPTATPAYVPGTHPLDRMPLCRLRTYARCPAGHVKHPLQRFDRDGPEITAGPGFHSVHSRVPPFEPEAAILLHHFPFREEATTRARLAAFCGPRPDAEARGAFQSGFEREAFGKPSAAMRRWEMLDAIYGGSAAANGLLAGCRPFAEQVAPADARVARWY